MSDGRVHGMEVEQVMQIIEVMQVLATTLVRFMFLFHLKISHKTKTRPKLLVFVVDIFIMSIVIEYPTVHFIFIPIL